MDIEIFKKPRNPQMLLGKVYFWTNTIKDWKKLLQPDKYKQNIIQQLKWLVQRNKITVYGYVIMPNHLHLIWEMLQKNGKEMPHASFNKFTSSNFLKTSGCTIPKFYLTLKRKPKKERIGFGNATH